MIDFLKHNAIRIAIAVVFLLILTGATLSYYNRYTMSNALVVKEQSEYVLKEIDRIHDNIRFMDISARGFALIRQRPFLFWRANDARNLNQDIFQNLDSLFRIQGFEDMEYEKLKKAMNHYTGVFDQMVKHLENNSDSEYLAMLEHDYGKIFYQTFTPLLDNIAVFQTQQATGAQEQDESAVTRNRIVQLLLFLVGLPTLIWVLYKLWKDERERKILLLDLEKNNRQYVFDNGEDSERDVRGILQISINNLQQASKFVTEISMGNYEVGWEGIGDENISLNKSNLAGKLILMRDEMKKIREDDNRRIWTTQGLSELSDMIRKHQGNLVDLNWHVLTFLVKYLQSQQGGLFVLKQNTAGEQHLELAACYAYDRKKVIEKTVRIGEGMLGQVFLEGQTVLLKKVPDKYLNITSGLGYATPRCVVIVPMKHNDSVQAILELASFNDYLPHEVAFIERAGEFVASAIFTAEQNERNKSIMEQLQFQAEQLHSQEEELRQNIEELEATQEAMRRKEVTIEADGTGQLKMQSLVKNYL